MHDATHAPRVNQIVLSVSQSTQGYLNHIECSLRIREAGRCGVVGVAGLGTNKEASVGKRADAEGANQGLKARQARPCDLHELQTDCAAPKRK